LWAALIGDHPPVVAYFDVWHESLRTDLFNIGY